ncbi:MAG: VWA domain-containing protein [Actinobacteria bacterium]|nr:MAG: VWA domain-containing protein [Actinomycetota bacterium]
MGGVPLTFPFTAVVGQDEAKLALLLNALDPKIGGVLLRGEKGSAKSTLARGLASLLPGEAPFVELPVGATEDRVVGTLDIEGALGEGTRRFQPGLLAAAHGGVLYVDEVNLLPDHLVDVLLDVAASGINTVEREGISERHPSQFVLVGSMNPEEGELRPQLLDRFGLAVDVKASTDADERAEAVRRRLAFDADPTKFATAFDETELADRLDGVGPAALPADLVEVVTRLCASVGAEGLRADLVICRAAAALAGWEGRDEAAVEDVRRVAALALAHRRRRTPFEEPGISQDEVDEAIDGDDGGAARDRTADSDDPPARVVALDGVGGQTSGRRSTVRGTRGRLVGDRVPDGPVASLAVGATVRAAAARGAAAVDVEDVREAVREQKAGNLVVLAVDASGSMGVERRMEAVKGAVVGLLLDAYQRRDRVALVTFRDEAADVALRPTGSVEVAQARLRQLPTGGRTPLAAGITAALDVAVRHHGEHRPLLVVVTDGRHTSGPDPTEAAAAVRRRGVRAVVVDAEEGRTRLGLARTLAGTMGATYLTLSELTVEALR